MLALESVEKVLTSVKFLKNKLQLPQDADFIDIVQKIVIGKIVCCLLPFAVVMTWFLELAIIIKTKSWP